VACLPLRLVRICPSDGSWRGGRRRNGEDEILTQYLWGSEVGTLAEGRRAKKSQPVSGGGVRPPQDPTMRGHDCLLDESQSPAAAHSLHKYYDMLSEYPQCVRRQAAPYHGNALGRSRRTRHIAASAEDPAYLLASSPLLRPRWRRIVLAVAAFFRADIDHAIDHARSEAGT
jgi:hypothetical protein